MDDENKKDFPLWFTIPMLLLLLLAIIAAFMGLARPGNYRRR